MENTITIQVAVTYPHNTQNLLAEELGLNQDQFKTLAEMLTQGRKHKLVDAVSEEGENGTAFFSLTVELE
ncbi:MAG: hypothetical protein LCH37_15245 [Bacteroidetes bacterium]|nr:hypothetical protein [Bacteroidota bacterium]